MRYHGINSVIQDSIIVADKTILERSSNKKYVFYSPKPLLERFKRKNVYNVYGTVLGFIYHGSFYITPNTDEKLDIVSAVCQKEDFPIPMSGYDQIINGLESSLHWYSLEEKAKTDRYDDLGVKCAKWCNNNEIGSLPDALLDNCFEVPMDGIMLETAEKKKEVYMPTINNTTYNKDNTMYLGTYNVCNDRVAFVYRNGRTYIAKGTGILVFLKSAGYRKTGLYVPFSRDEKILNPKLKAQFNAIRRY